MNDIVCPNGHKSKIRWYCKRNTASHLFEEISKLSTNG